MGTKKPAIDPHEAVQKILLHDYYSKQIRKFTTETFRILSNERDKALEQARKAIEDFESEKLTDEYVEKVADGMQELARKIFAERAKKTSRYPKK